jgi:F-type H+-transporting ATPase subunit delta
MAERGTVARPYAQAVFELARADGQLQAWSDFLKVAAVLAAEPEVVRMLFTPGADLMRLAATIADLCREQLGTPAPLRDGPKSPGANFLKLLADNQRLSVLPDISARFEALKAEAENTLEVTLTSASPVSEEQQARIMESLQKRFGRRIRVNVELNPDLVGGARLQVGDRVIDGSVRTGLDKLATTLRA